MARAPEAGQCKSRLVPALGPVGAARLARRLLDHTVREVMSAGLAPGVLCCHPGTGHPAFAQQRLERWPQEGADLGARMLAAAKRALRQCEGVLLIGTDCPALSADYLGRALDALQRADLVLGPAEDGGYVLAGLKRAEPALFQGIPWGGDQVLESTLQRARALAWKVALLDPLWDVDRPSDLVRLRREFPTIASG